MKPAIWLLVAWKEAERLARGELPRRVQRVSARALKGAALPPRPKAPK